MYHAFANLRNVDYAERVFFQMDAGKLEAGL